MPYISPEDLAQLQQAAMAAQQPAQQPQQQPQQVVFDPMQQYQPQPQQQPQALPPPAMPPQVGVQEYPQPTPQQPDPSGLGQPAYPSSSVPLEGADPAWVIEALRQMDTEGRLGLNAPNQAAWADGGETIFDLQDPQGQGSALDFVKGLALTSSPSDDEMANAKRLAMAEAIQGKTGKDTKDAKKSTKSAKR